MSAIGVSVGSPELSHRLDLYPVITSIAAAVGSVSFYRTWSVFTLQVGGTSPLVLTGKSLARQFSSGVPWNILTPVFLLLILLASIVRLFKRSGVLRVLYVLVVVAVGIPCILWPAHAIGIVTKRLSMLANKGLVQMELSVWWWLYATAIIVAVVSVIIDLVFSLVSARKQATPQN